MAKLSIPYLVEKQDVRGVRRYWQPNKALREAGWVTERLHGDDAAQLGRARELARQVEAWRMGEGQPNGAPLVARAIRRGRQLVPGSVDALIEAYKASRFYRTLAKRTCEEYDDYLDMISRWAGDKPARAISPAMGQDLYNLRFDATPARANALMRVARLLWGRGVLLGVVPSNPFARPALIGLAPSGRPWPRSAIGPFVAAADAIGLHAVGDAVMANEWIGQREDDVLNLSRKIRESFGLAFRQGKTGAGIMLQISGIAPLTERLLRADERQRKAGIAATTLIVNEQTGLPYNEHTFRHDFAKVRAAMSGDFDDAATADAIQAIGGPWHSFETDWLVAGRANHDADALTIYTAELIFKDLRHTAVLRLSEAGVPINLICSISGHTPESVHRIIKTYLVNSRRQAAQAISMRLAYEAAQTTDAQRAGENEQA